MKRFPILAGIVAITLASPAAAGHLVNLETPYASRGACESAVAQFNADDREILLANLSAFFSSNGEVASFLTRAFPCELDESDGQWYIQDDRLEVLQSDWYKRRQ